MRRGPLLAVAAACVLLVGVVWLLAVQVPEAGWIDVDVALTAEALRTPVLDVVARALAVVGDTAGVAVATLAAAAALARIGRRRDAVFVAGTVAAGFAAGSLLKALVGRARPVGAGVVPVPDTSSFPSGHVVAAACFAGALAMLVWVLDGATARQRALALVAAVAWVLSMAASRVYLGVHFASDVVAGALLGGAVVSASTALYLGAASCGHERREAAAAPLTPPEA